MSAAVLFRCIYKYILPHIRLYRLCNAIIKRSTDLTSPKGSLNKMYCKVPNTVVLKKTVPIKTGTWLPQGQLCTPGRFQHESFGQEIPSSSPVSSPKALGSAAEADRPKPRGSARVQWS